MQFSHKFNLDFQAEIGTEIDFPEVKDCPLWLQLRSQDLRTTADIHRAPNGDTYMTNYKVGGVLLPGVWKIGIGQFFLGLLIKRMAYEDKKAETTGG